MSVYQRSPDATWRRLPDRVILAIPESAEPLQLNAAAAEVWHLLIEPAKASFLAEQLSARFHRPLGEMVVAVAVLLNDLEAMGLVAHR